MIENPMVLPQPNYKAEKKSTVQVDLSFLEAETKEFNRKALEQFKRNQEAKKNDSQTKAS